MPGGRGARSRPGGPRSRSRWSRRRSAGRSDTGRRRATTVARRRPRVRQPACGADYASPCVRGGLPAPASRKTSAMRGAGDGPRGFRRARSAVTAAFATHALLSGSLGPWIPRLKAQTGLDPAGLGVALTGYAAGLLLGTRVAGWALRRVGGRPLVRAGIPALAIGFALLALPRGLTSLTAVFVGIGLAAGLVDVAMNTEAVAVEQGFGRTVLSVVHGAWSMSVFVGAAVASAGVAAGIPITVSLAASSAILAATSFPL